MSLSVCGWLQLTSISEYLNPSSESKAGNLEAMRGLKKSRERVVVRDAEEGRKYRSVWSVGDVEIRECHFLHTD